MTVQTGGSSAAAETRSVTGCYHAVLMAGCYTLWSRGRRIIRIAMTVEAVGYMKQWYQTPPTRMTTSELWCLSGSKREDYQNCSVLYCVLKLCTVINTLRWAVLAVLYIGFCHTGPISLRVDLFVFICVYVVWFCFILHSCCIIVSTVGWAWWDWSFVFVLRTYIFLQCFDTVGWVIWPVKPVPDMTYNVFGGTLNLALAIYHVWE